MPAEECPVKSKPQRLIQFISSLPDLGYAYTYEGDAVSIRLNSSDEIAHRIVGELIAAEWNIDLPKS